MPPEVPPAPANSHIRREVQRKLEILLARIRAADRLPRSMGYQAHQISRWYASGVSVLGGVGLVIWAPLGAFADPAGARSSPPAPDDWAQVANLPGWAQAFVFLVLASLFLLQLYSHATKLSERGPLFAMCVLELRKLEGRVYDTLRTREPLPKLQMLEDQAIDLCNRYLESGILKRTVPDTEWLEFGQEQARELCDQYADGWIEIPDPMLVQRREARDLVGA